MATLRVPGSPALPSVRQAGLPTVRVDLPTADVGAQVAGAVLQKAGGELSAFAAQAKQQADETAVNESLVDMQGFLSYRLGDPTAGLLHKQGKNAAEDSAYFYKALDDKRQRILETLQGRQRELFNQRSTSMLFDARRQVEGHVARESRSAYVQSVETLAAASLNDVASAAIATTPEEAAVREAKILAGVRPLRELYMKEGLDAETREAKVRDFRAKAADVVLQQHIQSGKGREGLAYLAQVRELLGPKAALYEKQLEGLADASAADGTSARIVTEARIQGFEWVDPAKAYASVDALPGDTPRAAAFKKEVRARVEHLVEKAKGLREEAGKEKLNEAIAIFERTGNMNDARIAPLREWMLNPPNAAADKWSRFKREVEDHRARLRGYNAEERRQKDMTDAEHVQAFRALPPEQQAQFDIEGTYSGVVSKLGRGKMAEVQKHAREVVRNGQEVQEGDFRRMVKDQLDAMPMLSGNKPERERIEGLLEGWRLKYLRDKKDNPLLTEVQEFLADRLLLNTGGFWGRQYLKVQRPEAFDYTTVAPMEEQAAPIAREAEFYNRAKVKPEAASGEPAAAAPAATGSTALDIPADVRALAVQQYKDSHGGTPPTEAQLQDAWRAHLAKKAKGGAQ
jgi:hypothetical protein